MFLFYLKNRQSAYEHDQKELNCVFVDLGKVCDRVQREQLYFCMRQFGLAEKQLRVVQGMYESCKTEVRCSLVLYVTDEFQVEVGLHQKSALNSILFAVKMGRLIDQATNESQTNIKQ